MDAILRTRMDLSDNDKDMLALAANMRANYIESGNPVLSVADVRARERSMGRAIRPRPLGTEQYELIRRLRELVQLLNEAKGGAPTTT